MDVGMNREVVNIGMKRTFVDIYTVYSIMKCE